MGVLSALASYFPYSFKDSPRYGDPVAEQLDKNDPDPSTKGYYGNINNRLRFDSIRDGLDWIERYLAEGEVWAGAFWELRQGFGRDAQGNHLADVLLMRTALNLSPPSEGAEARADFVRQLLEQERRVTGGRFASLIRDVFQRRGLKF
jgi:hypothetical protein